VKNLLIILTLLSFSAKAQKISIFHTTPKNAKRTYTIDYQKPKGGVELIMIKADSMRVNFKKPGTYAIKLLAQINGMRDSGYTVFVVKSIDRNRIMTGYRYETKQPLK
jgi:hypothetical protein